MIYPCCQGSKVLFARLRKFFFSIPFLLFSSFSFLRSLVPFLFFFLLFFFLPFFILSFLLSSNFPLLLFLFSSSFSFFQLSLFFFHMFTLFFLSLSFPSSFFPFKMYSVSAPDFFFSKKGKEENLNLLFKHPSSYGKCLSI